MYYTVFRTSCNNYYNENHILYRFIERPRSVDLPPPHRITDRDYAASAVSRRRRDVIAAAAAVCFLLLYEPVVSRVCRTHRSWCLPLYVRDYTVVK